MSLRLVAGRTPASDGLRHAERLGYPTPSGGLEALLAGGRRSDVVFDATNAASHHEHWRRLAPLGCLVVDLTPSRIGQMVVPSVTGVRLATEWSILDGAAGAARCGRLCS